MTTLLNQASSLVGGAADGLKKAAAEKVIEQVEKKYDTMLPGWLKPFSPCYGGAVPTLHACRCAVPDDQKDEFDVAYTEYAEAKSAIKNM